MPGGQRHGISRRPSSHHARSRFRRLARRAALGRRPVPPGREWGGKGEDARGVRPADGRVNRRIEQVVTELDGRKSLYSTAFYDRQTFEATYGGDDYEALKDAYDPDRRLLDLYAKVVEQR